MPPPGPTGLEHLPEPSALHARFSVNGPVNWGDTLPSAAEIAKLHGTKDTSRSLRLLERTVATEPRVTAELLAAMPAGSSAYQLASRIKSPESLARKLHELRRSRQHFKPDDVLRYTVLTEVPDALVAAARHSCDELSRAGWRVKHAMQSYTEGSRYKGIHAYLATPSNDLVEVQFHSVASVKVKEATTSWYEIERDARSSPTERTDARMECVRLSATLAEPPGIDRLTDLGGRRVAVNNYSDSRERGESSAVALAQSPGGRATGQTQTTRNDGISR